MSADERLKSSRTARLDERFSDVCSDEAIGNVAIRDEAFGDVDDEVIGDVVDEVVANVVDEVVEPVVATPISGKINKKKNKKKTKQQ